MSNSKPAEVFSPLGMVLCGLGRMGMIHIDNILSCRDVHLKYIVEADLIKAQEVKAKFLLNETKILHYDDFQQALDDHNTQSVIICTPTDTHEDLVLKALSAGKNTLCEKPLARDISTVVKCYTLAAERQIVLLCAFQRRFDPQICELQENIDKVGLLQSVKICSRDSPRPTKAFLKLSGGIFHDCLVHDLDLLRFFVKEDPVSIYSLAHVYDPEIAAMDDVDTLMVVAKFPSGVLAHVDISRDCRFGYDQTVQLYGDEGNIMSDNPRKTSVTYNGGKKQDDIHYSFHTRYAQAYKNELRHFIELIKDKSLDRKITALDTIKATCLSQAAEDSWRQGRVIDVKSFMAENVGQFLDSAALLAK